MALWIKHKGVALWIKKKLHNESRILLSIATVSIDTVPSFTSILFQAIGIKYTDYIKVNDLSLDFSVISQHNSHPT